LIDSLVGLGQLDEARALAPRTWAAGQRFGTPVVLPPLVSLAAAQRRFKAAARLLGYARQAHESHGMGVSTDDEDLLQDVYARVAAELGKAETEAAVAEGRRLSDEAAATLAAGDESPPAQAGEG